MRHYEGHSLRWIVLYKTLHSRQVEDVPCQLPRSAIIQAFHQHSVMIRAIYPGFHIITNQPISSCATAFSIRNPESDVVTNCSLFSLDDGLGAEIQVALGMRIACQWTVHTRDEGSDKSFTRQTEEGSMPRRRKTSGSPSDLYLVEETKFDLLRPFDRWARTNRDKSKALENILIFLERLKSGEIEL
ncbi:hypothetical protein BJX61DRAFT_324057 [Aspergillus egyptiacus]|nr:hypothetical protein BJX61DRAFT_324057 [Aspergillus egyptiacus]